MTTPFVRGLDIARSTVGPIQKNGIITLSLVRVFLLVVVAWEIRLIEDL